MPARKGGFYAPFRAGIYFSAPVWQITRSHPYTLSCAVFSLICQVMYIADQAACIPVDLDADILAVVKPLPTVCLRADYH